MASSIPNRGPELLAVDIAFMTAAIIANALRCYVRLTMVKGFGVDDWLMAAATLAFIAYSSSSITGVTYGTGRHHADLPEENIEKATHCWWFCYLFYCVTMITSKLSIGYFLLRIAIKKLHAWIIYGAMFISVIAGGVFFLVSLFQCKPIDYFWNKNQHGACINIEVIVGLGFLYSVFSIISDFTFAILPVFLVWNLQLKRQTKIALIPLLTMGCIASSAVVARVPYLHKFRSPDFLWATLDIAIWSTVEQGLAITAGSLATLRPLFQLILQKLGLTTFPSFVSPSRYGNASPSASHVLASRRKQSRDELDMYKLSAAVESSQPTEVKSDDLSIQSPNWYQTNFSKATRESFSAAKKKTPEADNESEKSLNTAQSNESMERDGMRIMVQTSFHMTNEPR